MNPYAENMVLIGYSERGLVNALVRFLMADPGNVRSFLACIEWGTPEIRDAVAALGRDPQAVTFVVEAGFADFGSPDLVLLVNRPEQQEPRIFFIEAKIASWGASARSNIVGMAEKGFNSSINGQLSLKYRLARALAAWKPGPIRNPKLEEPESLRATARLLPEEGGLRDDRGNGPRHLCKEVNLALLARLMKPAGAVPTEPPASPEEAFLRGVYYVALTLDDAHPLQSLRAPQSPEALKQRHATAPWYFPTENHLLAAQAWSHTGWCGWLGIEQALPALLEDVEYAAARRLSIEKPLADAKSRPTAAAGASEEEIRSLPWPKFPGLHELALDVAGIATQVAQGIPRLDARLDDLAGSISVVVNGSVAAKVLPRPGSPEPFLLLGLACDRSVPVPPRFDQGIKRITGRHGARRFQCLRLDRGACPRKDSTLMADLQDYFAALAEIDG